MVAENQPGHIDQIKQTNAGAVYRLIDQLGPVSRIDLSRLAQLAPASITKIVREMLEAHLVQELEIKEAGNRGRPAVGLVVETEAWHYLSLRISRGEIFLALRDLSSKLVVEESQELALKDDSPLLDRIISHIDQFFIRHQKKLERLTSIAITLPGIIDTENGIVHRMPFYEDVKEMPLGEALEQHTGVPVYIQHDISAWTMAEALFGASRGARDVIQVVIDHNVGAGVITDGHLLHAGSSSLVEIGHTQVDPYGKRCYCGNHGCLETIASVDSILELAQLRLNQSMSSMLHGQPLTVDSLCQAALRGDLLAKDIITGVGAHVGRILAIMVNLFNPQKILIGSPLSKAADILFPVISDSIRQQALPAYSQHISVESTQFSNQGTMAGAALVKDAMYNGSLLIRLLQSVSTIELPYEAVNPIALSEEESSVAHSCPINYTLISNGLANLTDKVDHVVVEGTGGWRSLMNDLRPLSEWVVQEQLPVLMVVGIQEGCINHALLTAQAIANDGLPLIGWVANRINPGLAHYAEIIDVLGKKLPAPLIGELPYLPRAEQRELGQYIRLAMLRSVLAVDRVTV